MQAKQKREADATLEKEGKNNSLAKGREDVPQSV